MAMTLPTAEELFGETVRKVSSTPQEWLKFLNTASRVYQYTFDAQLMIYAQRPNAIGCTSFEKWKQMNHYVKRGTQGIALIVRNGENRKLRYVYDYSDTGVASNIPETDIRKPYIWSLGEDGQEDLCDYINNKYNIRPQNKDLGLVLKQLIEETVNDVIDDEISEILKEKQGSYLEDLDIDTIRKEYRELFIHSAWYMLLRRCGIEPGDYMYLEDFRAITDFNNINPIHQSEKLSHPHNESWIEKYNKTISQIKSQISYDSLILTNDTGIINDIVEVMADVMLLDTPSYKIEKKEIPSEIVRIRYKQLTYEKIETLLLDFNNITYEIHSKTSYLISSLYNISKTAETSLTNRVKHNMYDLC